MFNARKAPGDSQFHVTKVNLQHNHQWGPELIEQYAAIRRLNGDEKKFATPLIEANAPSSSISHVLSKHRGIQVLPKQIDNLKKVTNHFFVHLHL